MDDYTYAEDMISPDNDNQAESRCQNGHGDGFVSSDCFDQFPVPSDILAANNTGFDGLPWDVGYKPAVTMDPTLQRDDGSQPYNMQPQLHNLLETFQFSLNDAVAFRDLTQQLPNSQVTLPSYPPNSNQPGSMSSISTGLLGFDDLKSFNANSNHDPWNLHHSMPEHGLQSTPGFPAIPDMNLFPNTMPITNFGSVLTPIAERSGFGNFDYSYTNSMPIDFRQQNTSAYTEQQYGESQHQYSGENDNSSHVSRYQNIKRKFAPFDSDSNTTEYKRRQMQSAKQNSEDRLGKLRRDSTSSLSSSPSSPVQNGIIHPGEKPKRCEQRQWVRTNNSTKGRTTRTARINQFSENGPNYKHKPLAHKNKWSTPEVRFEYSNLLDMDIFKKHVMSATEIHEYITQYPGDNLRIWIQVTPGDSARRYASESHSHCLFEQCPNRIWARKGTIEVGNYRIAFDEKHKLYGKGATDPFDCAGFAHLYCMERFLDFAEICKLADVKVDTRSDLKEEPRGEGAFTFGKKHAPERAVAGRFLKAARRGQLYHSTEFSNYPVHANYAQGEPKPHEQTLVSAMFTESWRHRARSQKRQFVSRKIKPTSVCVHRGDQEIIVAEKKVESMKAYKKAKKLKKLGSFDWARYYDRINPEINIRMEESLKLRDRYKREDAGGRGPKRGGHNHRLNLNNVNDIRVSESEDEPNLSPHSESSDMSDDDDSSSQESNSYREGLRSSARNKPRVNYCELNDIPELESYEFDNLFDDNLFDNKGVNNSQCTQSSLQSANALGSRRSHHRRRGQINSDMSGKFSPDEDLRRLLDLPQHSSSTIVQPSWDLGPNGLGIQQNFLSNEQHGQVLCNTQPVTPNGHYTMMNTPTTPGSSHLHAALESGDHDQSRRRSTRLAPKCSIPRGSSFIDH